GRGKAGNYLSSKGVKPVNRSQAAAKQRTKIKTLANLWRNMSPPYHKAWNIKASGIKRNNRMGLPYNLTGFQLFCFFNRFRKYTSKILPPTDIERQSQPIITKINKLEVFPNSKEIELELTAINVLTNIVVQVGASRPLSPGYNSNRIDTSFIFEESLHPTTPGGDYYILPPVRQKLLYNAYINKFGNHLGNSN